MLRNWYSKLGLRTKATAMALAITTCSLAVVALTGIVQIRSQIAAEQHRTVDSIAMSMARASELALAVRDTAELNRLANGFLRDEHVQFVAALNESGQPIASAVHDQAEWEAFLNGQPNRPVIVSRQIVESSSQGNEFSNDAEVDAPAAKPKVVGTVVVGLSTAPAQLAQRQQSLVTLAVTGAAAFVGGLVLFSTLGMWMRRLQRVADASHAISHGNFDARIDDHRDDEIGRLADSFDSMCVALRERDDRLRNFTDTLQDQVRQRTADLETALETAEEANRAKSLFLANMSHELRTPLNGVIGMVDLMLAASPNPQQRRYCDVAKSSARALLDLINDILDFSKIEAGKLELDHTDFDLHEALEDVSQMLGERAEKKKIELICSVGRGVPQTVAGDPVRFRQVIANLVTNAIKFTETGEVVISAELQEETDTHASVRFGVRDTGIGIPPDRLDRLFKSFSQVDASTTRKFGGTGLGLAISRRIVELMGGTIGVESELGKGSTFYFVTRFEKRANKPARREAAFDPRGLRVLAVDDNLTNREILHAQLASWSLRADIAASAEEAMVMLHAANTAGEPYRFAILDMHMPKVDGMQLAQQIKGDPSTRDVLLISLSSISDTMRPQQMADVGFSACLTKPALPSQLYNAIIDTLASDERTDLSAAGRIIPPDATPNLTGVRVLLAEDNEINRMVASELLKQAGCACDIANNGREAVTTALAQTFDVILMDCQMPELDGFEATREIRAAEKAAGGAPHRAIIALTANAIKGDRELCLAAGMDGYVTKPIDAIELFKAIRAVLSAERLATIAATRVESAATEVVAAAPVPPSAPLAPVETAAPPINLQMLQQRCLGNRKLAAKVLGMFAGSIDQEMRGLLDCVGSGNAKAVATSAHRLKGSAANVSVEAVRSIAAELEKLAKADELGQAEACAKQLEAEVGRFKAFVETALQKLSVPDANAREAARD